MENLTVLGKEELVKKLSDDQIMMNSILNSTFKNVYSSAGTIETMVVNKPQVVEYNGNKNWLIQYNAFSEKGLTKAQESLAGVECFAGVRLDRHQNVVLDSENKPEIAYYYDATVEQIQKALSYRISSKIGEEKAHQFYIPTFKERVKVDLAMNDSGYLQGLPPKAIVAEKRAFNPFASLPKISDESAETNQILKEAGI
jgi:hypothetical protein